MKVGCVKEIKTMEFRVGMTPDNAKEYAEHGHEVYVESGAGEGSAYADADYAAAGARVLDRAADVWAACDMIVKVKEPLAEEYPLMRPGQILYTYLHLVANEELTRALMDCGVRGVAYETITDAKGALPLLKPMSEVAGRLSAKCLEKPMGGMGMLLGGVPGVRRAKVVIVGGGVVGSNACRTAVGLGADVTILDKNLDRLTYLDELYGHSIQTVFSSSASIAREVASADLVIGAVLIPGGATPKLIKREHVASMKPGSVIVDVAVDQGGCCETTRPTYHDAPTYQVDGVVHYCVGNMPGAVSHTSTAALTNATLAYGLMIADRGLEAAAKRDQGLLHGINTYGGHLVCKEVADSLSLKHTDIQSLL